MRKAAFSSSVDASHNGVLATDEIFIDVIDEIRRSNVYKMTGRAVLRRFPGYLKWRSPILEK